MKLNLNLASRTYVNRRALLAFYGALSGLLALLLAVNVVFFFRDMAHGRRVKAHLAELDQELGAQLAEAGPEAPPEELKDLRSEIEFANGVLERDSFRWTALLDHLEEVSFEGVTIQTIQPEFKDKTLKLGGQAKGVGELRTFLDRAIASPHFREVYLLDQRTQEVTDTLGRKRQAVSFNILLKGVF